MQILSTLGVQWKSLVALAGAATVGAAGGTYFTLPRVVAEIQAEQKVQSEQLEGLRDAVVANTQAIRLISCVQAANLMANDEESRTTIHSCIATFGVSARG